MNDLMIFMPSPLLAAGSKVSANCRPLLETDSWHVLFPSSISRSVISPSPYLAAFVISLHGGWTGQWVTTTQGQMSVCEIADEH